MGINLPTRRLVSQNDVAIIQRPDVPRSKFNGTWTRKTTFNAGRLVPFLVEEVLPGDHMTYNVTAHVRMSTPLFPMFDTQRIDTFFFFVPNRLTWKNWARFMGEQDEPTSSIAYTIPQARPDNAGGLPILNTLWTHFALPGPNQVTQQYTVSALPFRAYYLIWEQWFRDQNITPSQPNTMGDGPDDTVGVLAWRMKSHDYFTSCLPWPQKFTAPNVPLLGTAPITGIGAETKAAGSGVGVVPWETSGLQVAYGQSKDFGNIAANSANQLWAKTRTSGADQILDIYADLTAATGVSINQLRQAWLVQSLLERDARGGTRYVELIKSHFGVTNPDFRLQRPEYIGGGQTPLQLTPIAQTAPTTGIPLGALGAAGTAAGTNRASYAATEHGYIIGIINVRSELSYQQGIHKSWSRLTRQEFYFPSLAGLGEQAVLRKEIYATGDAANDDVVFGYQERWQEYRTRYSEVTNLFNSKETGNIDEWHLSQEFTAAPTLSTTFLNDEPPMPRVLAAGTSADKMQYLAHILINRTAVRPIPMFGTPSTLGRF